MPGPRATTVWAKTHHCCSCWQHHQPHAGQYAARDFDPALLKRLELPEAAPCENTLEAARVLLFAARGPTPPRDLQYVEFDVQVCVGCKSFNGWGCI